MVWVSVVLYMCFDFTQYGLFPQMQGVLLAKKALATAPSELLQMWMAALSSHDLR